MKPVFSRRRRKHTKRKAVSETLLLVKYTIPVYCSPSNPCSTTDNLGIYSRVALRLQTSKGCQEKGKKRGGGILALQQRRSTHIIIAGTFRRRAALFC